MQLKPRLALAALGLVLAPFVASAQHIELVTEAPVTFELTFNTFVTSTNGLVGAARVDTTRSYNSTITTNDILTALKTEGLITDASTVGYRLVAVRPLPADLIYVNTEFQLYAIKTDTATPTRIYVPEDFFSIIANYSVENFSIRHSTRNILTSSGTVTNQAEFSFVPTFTRKEVPPVITGPFVDNSTGTPRNYNLSTKTNATFTLSALESSGFSTIPFRIRTDEPVFFYAIDTVRYTSRGDFSGSLINTVTPTRKYTTRNIPDLVEPEVVDTAPTQTSGLVSVRLTVGTPKLVDRSLYPEVSFED